MPRLLLFIIGMLFAGLSFAQPLERHNLKFDTLAAVWDEAIPLGNATVGALIWQKDGKLRFSLDRADLWDMRPMAGLHREEFRYKWVQEQVAKKDYKPVQQYFDVPYDKGPAPSKIPGGALEFVIPGSPNVKSVTLSLARALCEVEWDNGDDTGWDRNGRLDSIFLISDGFVLALTTLLSALAVQYGPGFFGKKRIPVV